MSKEQDFLREYSIEDYPRPSVTADIVTFMIRLEKEESYRKNPEKKLSVLLVRRGGHPFKGRWALPGGFLQPGETVEQCALREIAEETGVTPAALKPVGVFSTPGRDPRGWIISNAYAAVISEEGVQEAGGDDADEARWFTVEFNGDEARGYNLTLVGENEQLSARLSRTVTPPARRSYRIEEDGGLAFDHALIIAEALTQLRQEAANFDTIFDFLPEKFTLTALQKVQETVLNISLLPANFRRKVSDYVTETEEYTAGAGHRPAKLFVRK